MLQLPRKKEQCEMGARGRHQKLFRPNQSQLDGRQYPNGKGDLKEVARGGIHITKIGLPQRTRGPTKGHHFTRGGQKNTKWTRENALVGNSTGKSQRLEKGH